MSFNRGDGVVLVRDVSASVIPQGHMVLLLGGTLVSIIQALGGSHTVEFNGQWLLIHEEDSDALGLNPSCMQQLPEGSLEDQIWSILKTCYDPEIPVNIVDLGLIYEVGLTEVSERVDVYIGMTLTAPGCGMGPVLIEEIERKVKRLSKVGVVKIQMLFDPPWTQDRMSEEAQLSLGLL